MKIKPDTDASTDEFWYDLSEGGGLKPQEICEDPADAQRVIDAIAVIKDFAASCEDQIEGFYF